MILSKTEYSLPVCRLCSSLTTIYSVRIRMLSYTLANFLFIVRGQILSAWFCIALPSKERRVFILKIISTEKL